MVTELVEKVAVEPAAGDTSGHETVFVDQFTNGVLDPNRPMLGPGRGAHRRQYRARLLGADDHPGHPRRP